MFCTSVTIHGDCSNTAYTNAFCELQVQQLQSDLEQSRVLANSLDAQLLESNEVLSKLQSTVNHQQSVSAQPRKKSSGGPGGAVGWVLRTGATVGGTILAGHAVQHYHSQQPRKEQ